MTFNFYEEIALRKSDKLLYTTDCSRESTAKKRFKKQHDNETPVVMVTLVNAINIGQESIYFGIFRK